MCDAAAICLTRRTGALLAPHLVEVAGLFMFYPPQERTGLAQEDGMAKGQRRSNREIRKPKKKKETAVAPVGLTKGVSASLGLQKKKS